MPARVLPLAARARLLAGLRLSIGLLTVFPARAGVADRESGRLAIMFAPLVGLALWVPAAALGLAVRSWLAPVAGGLSPAVVEIATVAVLTRGLHLDGLADVGDALASYRPAEQAREIMRRGDVGPLGVATLVLVLLGQVALLDAAIRSHHGTVTLLVALLSGRLALVASCVATTPVAPGSSMGVLVVGTVSRRAVALTTIAVVAGCGLAAQLDVDTANRGAETVQAALAPMAALIVLWPLRRHLLRRLGGINGDALGAQCEFAVLVAMLVMAGKP